MVRASYEMEYASRRIDLGDLKESVNEEIKELTNKIYTSQTQEEFDMLMAKREEKVSKAISLSRQIKEISTHPDVNERSSDALERIATALENIHDDLVNLSYKG